MMRGLLKDIKKKLYTWSSVSRFGILQQNFDYLNFLQVSVLRIQVWTILDRVIRKNRKSPEQGGILITHECLLFEYYLDQHSVSFYQSKEKENFFQRSLALSCQMRTGEGSKA